MDNLLKKAGAMTAHLELFEYLLHLRGLLQLSAHMEERGDRVTMVSAENITLMGGTQTEQAPVLQTSKGAHIAAAHAYGVLQRLKGHEAAEYAVTREELAALNNRAVAELEDSAALRAFGETLGRVAGSVEAADHKATDSKNDKAAESNERSRQRRSENQTTDKAVEGAEVSTSAA